MSGESVSRRRFLGAAAVLSALPAVEGAGAEQPDPGAESGDSAHGRARDSLEEFVEDPIRGSAVAHATSGPFDVNIWKDPGDIEIDAHPDNGEIMLGVRTDDRRDLVFLSLDVDAAGELAAMLPQFVEKARNGERLTYP